MPRWNYDDDEQENVDRFFGDMEDEEVEEYISEEDYEELVARAGHLQEVQLQLVEQDLNQRLLADAVSLAKKSWRWWFMSGKARRKEIAQTYRFFQRLTDCKGQKEK